MSIFPPLLCVWFLEPDNIFLLAMPSLHGRMMSSFFSFLFWILIFPSSFSFPIHSQHRTDLLVFAGCTMPLPYWFLCVDFRRGDVSPVFRGCRLSLFPWDQVVFPLCSGNGFHSIRLPRLVRGTHIWYPSGYYSFLMGWGSFS